MPPKTLGEIQRRVVGVLVEKLLSTPQYFPLTMNALVAGCNQKNNREPEMDLSDDLVRRTLEELQGMGLAVSVYAEGARAEKWRTPAKDVFALASEKQMAVFAELLLRGPATKSELKTRASRMRHEVTIADLDGILDEFQKRPEPLAVNLGRAPGGRAERYTHTLWSEDELAKLRAGSAPAATATAPRAAAPAAEASPELAEKLDDALREIAILKDRVDALERDLAELRGH